MFEGCEIGCDAAVKTFVDFSYFQIKMFEDTLVHRSENLC